MKPVLAMDLRNVLLRERPFQEAHRKWFEIMAELLQDETILQYAEDERYFYHVPAVMQRYMGSAVHETTRTQFARNLYGLLLVGETRKEDVVDEFKIFLERIREKYATLLITTTPEDAITPLLEKIDCIDLFAQICSSETYAVPDKGDLIAACIRGHGSPRAYITSSFKPELAGRSIPLIVAGWAIPGTHSGDNVAHSIADLERLVG